MTKEEFIKAKKQAKFNFIWDNIINKLPKSNQKSFVKLDYAFNVQLVNHKEYYIICHRRCLGAASTSRLLFTKSNLEAVFVDYEQYLDEIKDLKLKARGRVDHALEMDYDDIVALKKKCAKDIKDLRSEKTYARILIKIGGSSLKKEMELAKLQTSELGDYVHKIRKEKCFNNIYFEFKQYGVEKLSQVILHKYKVYDILIEPRTVEFAQYCREQKILDIYDLLLIQFYSKLLVYRFGPDCLQAVINSIKTFIELQTFEYENISFEDLE